MRTFSAVVTDYLGRGMDFRHLGVRDVEPNNYLHLNITSCLGPRGALRAKAAIRREMVTLLMETVTWGNEAPKRYLDHYLCNQIAWRNFGAFGCGAVFLQGHGFGDLDKIFSLSQNNNCYRLTTPHACRNIKHQVYGLVPNTPLCAYEGPSDGRTRQPLSLS